MDYLAFLHYTQQHNLETREVVALAVSLAVLVFTGFVTRKLWRDFRQHKPLTYREMATPFAGLLLSSLCLLLAYSGPRARYLLRAGAHRYIVARVIKYSSLRGNQEFVYEYYVAGQRYQSACECGPEDWRTWACPTLGTRCYVQFALADPSTEQLLKQAVPDSVQHVPPLGWARLP